MTKEIVNSWTEGKKKALSQPEHARWNAAHYPGTRQLCSICDDPTGRCEEDELIMNEQTVCENCYVSGDEEE